LRRSFSYITNIHRMATINEGILGSFRGSIGPVTGYIRNGQNILRSSTSHVKYKRTALRSAQLEKIKLCNNFTTAFSRRGFFNKTFPAYGAKGTGHNRCTSAILNRAIVNIGGVLQLSYANILVAKGMLPQAEGAHSELIATDILQFTFTNNSSTGTAAADDAVVLVAYCTGLQQAVFALNAGRRAEGIAALNVAAFKGYTVETWIAFLSSDEKNASDSVYTGQFSL
jgi:hypothetical protein